MIRQDACPGCSETMLDCAEKAYEILCSPQTSGPCPVEVGESP